MGESILIYTNMNENNPIWKALSKDKEDYFTEAEYKGQTMYAVQVEDLKKLNSELYADLCDYFKRDDIPYKEEGISNAILNELYGNGYVDNVPPILDREKDGILFNRAYKKINEELNNHHKVSFRIQEDTGNGERIQTEGESQRFISIWARIEMSVPEIVAEAFKELKKEGKKVYTKQELKEQGLTLSDLFPNANLDDHTDHQL